MYNLKVLVFSFFIFVIPSMYVSADRTAEEAFTAIYKNKVWGSGRDGKGSSGGGSTLETTVLYRQFLQDFFSVYNIRSVVDVGCGDWEFSRAINWNGINYVGYDVVSSLITKNQRRYTASNIRFLKGDATSTDFPEADLVICKDVLQHLPNQDITVFINQLHKFKYCLITNDIGTNTHIQRGQHRGVDLTQPPFTLKGVKILTYQSDLYMKQVLLICREDLQ